MRHRVAHRKLGRVTEHRIALLRNQASALLKHERIETTVPKAKELRPYVERLITIAKRGIAEGGATTKALHARRLVLEDIPDRAVVGKLFESIAPRFQGRPGGYTRILRVGFRRGDSAEVAQIELVGSEYNPRATEETPETEAAPAPKGVAGRIRAAASRIRGRRSESPAGDSESKAKAKPQGQAKARPGKARTRSGD
ncbi:MAG: 50S ribosomal protein L17 [Vicinamibacterales bacterium]